MPWLLSQGCLYYFGNSQGYVECYGEVLHEQSGPLCHRWELRGITQPELWYAATEKVYTGRQLCPYWGQMPDQRRRML